MDAGSETSRYFVPLDMFAGTWRLSNRGAAVTASLVGVRRPARAWGARRPPWRAVVTTPVPVPVPVWSAAHRGSSSTAAGQAAHGGCGGRRSCTRQSRLGHQVRHAQVLARGRRPDGMTRSGKQSEVLGGLKAGPSVSVSASQHHDIDERTSLLHSSCIHRTAWLPSGQSRCCLRTSIASASRRKACNEH